MNRHIGISFTIISMLFPAAIAFAAANCDGQAKPALDCPSGYSVVCNPVGGWHWSCGKEGLGASGAQGGSPSAPGVGQNNQTDLDFVVGLTNKGTTSQGTSTQTGSATSSERSKGAMGDLKGGANASSSDERPLWGMKGGLVGFLRSIFGLGEEASVGEVRTQIDATTTAGVSATSTSQGLGFWARVLGLFGFGK